MYVNQPTIKYIGSMKKKITVNNNWNSKLNGLDNGAAITFSRELI